MFLFEEEFHTDSIRKKSVGDNIICDQRKPNGFINNVALTMHGFLTSLKFSYHEAIVEV